MDNFNGQNQFGQNQFGQDQFQADFNSQNQFDPNLQNMQMMQQNMYQQPNVWQQPNFQNGRYMKPKSNAWVWIVVIILAFLLVVGGSIFAVTACVGVAVSSSVNDYVDTSKYNTDLVNFDMVNLSIKTFVADPDSVYENGKVYTLTELMESSHDPGALIMEILTYDDFIELGTFPYEFKCHSDAFVGTTTDDVLVCIDDIRVSIYIPVNKKYADDYESYKIGNEFADKK